MHNMELRIYNYTYKGYMHNGVEEHTQYSCILEIEITLKTEV